MRRLTKKRVLLLFRLAVALTVLICLIYTLKSAFGQLAVAEFKLSQLRFEPLLLALLCYITAMTLSGLFWYRVLLATGNRLTLRRTMLAFFASQFGKYIPGKAMVVVIRTDLVRGSGVQTSTAAATVFVETLTWIFVGSAIASLLLASHFQNFPLLQIGAGVMMLTAGVMTWPPLFRRVASRFLANSRTQDPMAGLTLSVMLSGWALMTVGWLLNGLSLWFVTASLTGAGVMEVGFQLSDYQLCLACVSLATVAGFVSLLPGGLGVRELVMIPILGSGIGRVNAVVAAILIRFVWLASELITSGIIYGYTKLTTRPEDLDPS